MNFPPLLAVPDASVSLTRRLAGPIAVLLLSPILTMAYQFSQPSFVSCFVDDSILHISWCTQFKQAILEGQWIPRWLPLGNGGYGSPVFVFYSPLVYYITTVFGLVLPIVTAMKVVKLLGFFLSGLAMYGFASHLFGRRAGLLAAILYQVLPYHILDNYYWTFYAETWAWIWFPLILRCLLKCVREPHNPRGFLGAAFSYAALILTHLVSAFMFSLVAVAFLIWQGVRTWRFWWLRMGMAGLGCVLMTAYYMVPMIYEQRFVHIDQIVRLVNFENTFVFFPNEAVHKHYRFFLNIILLLQWVTGFQMLLAVASHWSFSRLSRGDEDGKAATQRFRYFFALTVVCVFFTTEWSRWIWRMVPGFSQIQFPMRWLAFMTLGCSCIGGAAFGAILTGKKKLPIEKLGSILWMGTLFLCVLVSFAIIANSCFLEEEAGRLAQLHAYNATEYNPRWTPHPEQRLVMQEEPLFQLNSGQGKVEVKQWKSHTRTLQTEATGPLLIRLRLFDYPGWSAYLDGVSHPIQRQSGTGAILVSVPEGRHQLLVRFEETIWRRWSRWLSVISILGMGLAIGFSGGRTNSGYSAYSFASGCHSILH